MRDSKPVLETVNMQEFYEEISKGNSDLYAKINEVLYINAHTVYLADEENINYKRAFGDKWHKEFGKYPTYAQYAYIFDLYPFFIKYNLIVALKNGKIDNSRKMWITLTRLEMNLRLIECAEKNIEFTKKSFRDYMNEKYRFILENVIDNIEKTDIPFIEDFKILGDALLPFKAKIQKIYENFLSANDEVIQNEINAGRIIRVTLARDTGSDLRTERRNFESSAIPAKTKADYDTKTKPSATADATINIETPAEKKAEFDKERMKKDYELRIADYEETISGLERELKDYKLLATNHEEKIGRLERELKECKRQHDDLITSSAEKYDKGVKAFFNILNDKRYGKPLNFLYETFLTGQNLDANLRGILENLFMALEEEMKIKPITEVKESVLADPASLNKSYDLEFDIKDLVPEKVYPKYVGWKYKDTVIEKPTLAKKND